MKKKALLLILGDLIMCGLILCVFALFHHVLPLAAKQTVSTAATPAPTTELTEVCEEPSVLPPFTEETVIADMSYSSPNIAISISEYKHLDKAPLITVYVADIYLKDPKLIMSFFSENALAERPEIIHGRNSAILSINGDYCKTRSSGILVRNGESLLSGEYTMDVCAIFPDGSMETYKNGEYTEEELLEKQVWQLLTFGPALLDGDGVALTDFPALSAYEKPHPRTGIGYYEPGHYCFVVVDGRQPGHSDGCTLEVFAKIFESLGCIRAYNLDGGSSSIMLFMDRTINSPSDGGRKVSDILSVREAAK